MSSQSVTNIANAIINKINSLISSHNRDSNAHQDIRADIPAATSDLTNDMSFVTGSDIADKEDISNKVTSLGDFSTDTEYPSAKAVYDGIWTDLYGAIQNDYVPKDSFGEMAYHSYLSEIAGSTDIIDILQADGYSLFSGDYDDLDNKPSIPSNTSDLNNNSGFITSSSVPIASSTVPSADTSNGSVGNGTAWARSDHTHPKSSLYAEASHTHSDANITTLGFYGNLPQANYEGPSQQQVNFAINSAMGGKEDNANKVTSLSSSSTDTQYPSAKAVYDATFNLDILDCINENFTLLSLPQITFTHDGNPFDGSTVHILEGYDKGAYVDWGDGTPIETYESTDTLEHSYSDSVREHIITIYGDILNLYNNSFENFIRMTSINIPSGVTSLGDYCFNGCTGLTSIIIPSSVTSLGNNCFQSCRSLTNVTIPSSVTNLGNSCFYNCTGLTSVTIPSSVTNLRNRCFYKCTNLVDYQLYWETPPVTWNSSLMPNNTDTYFTIPNGTTANYTAKSFPSEKLVERSE